MKKITLEDGYYEIGGDLGSWAQSFESDHCKKGDVRLIGGVLMKATYAYRRQWPWRGFKICWTPVDDSKNSSESLREWIRGL